MNGDKKKLCLGKSEITQVTRQQTATQPSNRAKHRAFSADSRTKSYFAFGGVLPPFCDFPKNDVDDELRNAVLAKRLLSAHSSDACASSDSSGFADFSDSSDFSDNSLISSRR